MQENTAAECGEDVPQHTLSADEAKGMLAEALLVEIEDDGTWIWKLREEDGDWVALSERDWVEVHLAHDAEGKLVLARRQDSSCSAWLEGEQAKAFLRWALSSSPRRPPTAGHD